MGQGSSSEKPPKATKPEKPAKPTKREAISNLGIPGAWGKEKDKKKKEKK